MRNILVRGVPAKVRLRLQRLARFQNASMNQALLELLAWALEEKEKQTEAEHEREEVFRRVDELRERLRKKYGKFEDSTKLIREDRDSR